MLKRTFLKIATAFAVTATLTTGSSAAELTGPVNYIIPFGPGGESDISARFQQPFFKDKFGQDMVISYQPGGGGAVGWASLNGLSGDGQTIMGVNLPHIIIKPAQKDVGFTTEDLNVFHMFHYTPDAIIVKADSPYQTLDDLIQDAKANPAQVTMSGSGKATANHLAHIKFDKMADIQTTYVPFKGTGAAVTALLGNQVKAEWGYSTVAATQGEEVRMLAVAMDERHPLFPDVPTFKDVGLEPVNRMAYYGFIAPKGLPKDVTDKIYNATQQALKDPAVRKRIEDTGSLIVANTPEQFTAQIKAEFEVYKQVVAKQKLSLE